VGTPGEKTVTGTHTWGGRNRRKYGKSRWDMGTEKKGQKNKQWEKGGHLGWGEKEAPPLTKTGMSSRGRSRPSRMLNYRKKGEVWSAVGQEVGGLTGGAVLMCNKSPKKEKAS